MALNTHYSLTDQLTQVIQPEVEANKALDKCPHCNISMQMAENDTYVCPTCSLSKDYTTCGNSFNADNEYDHYNKSGNSFVSMKPHGAGSNSLRTTMLIYLSNYSALRNKKNHSKIEQYNYINPEFSLDKDVVTLASGWINDIDKIHRDDVRLGLFAAAMYFAAIDFGIVKPKEAYASMFKVKLYYVNEGIQLLRKYHTQGKIVIPINKVLIEDQVMQYCKLAKVPDKYVKFVTDVMNRIKDKHVDKLKNMFGTTKCIGIIYTLSKVVDDYDVDETELSRIAENLTPSAFKSAYRIIENNKKIFRKPFFRNKVPYPSKWDSDESEE
jgi:hypothetical protein